MAMYLGINENEQFTFHPTGWMANEPVANKLTQNQKNDLKDIGAQLGSRTHKLDEKRLFWLYRWLNNSSFNLDALSFIWDHPNFNPFATIDSAEQLITTSKHPYLVRLSTSCPGYLTVTYKLGGVVYHCRITKNDKMLLAYNTILFDSLANLIKQLDSAFNAPGLIYERIPPVNPVTLYTNINSPRDYLEDGDPFMGRPQGALASPATPPPQYSDTL